MSLEADLEHAVTGDAIEFTFTVRNTDAEPRRLEFRSGQIADIAVFDGNEEIWRRSDGRLFTQALQAETLEPGESLVRTGTWSNPVPGTYVVVATLQATNADVEARTELEV